MSVLEAVFPDDITRHLASLLLQHAVTPQVEIETKLGKIGHKTAGHTRSSLLSAHTSAQQVVLLEGEGHVFEAHVPLPVFQRVTEKILNGRIEREMADSRLQKRPSRLLYTHPVTTDLFYPSTHDVPIRVTLERDGKRTALIKRKLAHMDVMMPLLGPLLPDMRVHNDVVRPPPIDFRITVAEECVTELPLESVKPLMIRKKDRRSYQLIGEYTVDCTIVHSWYQNRDQIVQKTEGGAFEGKGEPEITYEVEMEMLPALLERLREARTKHLAHQSNHLITIAKACIDNSRSLARFAVESTIPPSCLPLNNAASSPPIVATQQPSSGAANGVATQNSDHNVEQVSKKRARDAQDSSEI